MFKKLVAIEPVNLVSQAEEELRGYAGEITLYEDVPSGDEEIIRRIGDADAVLVSYTSRISRYVIESCPSIRYIGMCCSLYDEKSANVDIARCREKGIVVLGVKDYGDNGVIEFGVSELIRLLHGFGEHQWRERPTELTGQKVGIIGLGTTGALMAHALQYFGADVHYYSRRRKPEEEARGLQYLPLDELLQQMDIISTHLNKNTILLHEREFGLMGDGKILLNTAIGPSFDVTALKDWLQKNKNSYYICDDVAMGGYEAELAGVDHVLYTPKSSGAGVQCTQRLSEKVVENVKKFLEM